MIFTQGSTYTLSFTLTDDDEEPITDETVGKIEFVIGKLTKTYPSTEVFFSDGAFVVTLTQEETFALADKAPIQARVKFAGGAVAASAISYHLVRDSLSKAVL